MNLINFTLGAQMGRDCVYVHIKVLFSNALIIDCSTVIKKLTLMKIAKLCVLGIVLSKALCDKLQFFPISHVSKVRIFNFFLGFRSSFSHDISLKV